MRKFYANANMLLRQFSKCSKSVTCHLFITYYSNLYCSTLWYNCTVTAMKYFLNVYNNNIIQLFCLPKHDSASEMCACIIKHYLGTRLSLFP